MADTWLSRIVIDVHPDGYSIKCTCGSIYFVKKFGSLVIDLEYHVVVNCPLTRSLNEWREPSTSEEKKPAASMSDSPDTTSISMPSTDTSRRWLPKRRPRP